jgi:hypothetical protein
MILAGIVACGSDDLTAPLGGHDVRVVSARMSPNPNDALAAFVTVTAVHADSARVLFLADGVPEDSTPSYPVADGNAVVPVLGLRGGTAYRGVVEVAGAAGRVRSDTVAFTSGAIPELLQHVTITTTGTGGPGLTLTAVQLAGTALFAFAFDSAGSIRWYRRFDDPRIGGELKQQPNGNFTMYIGESFGSQPVPGYYVEFTPAGDSLRAFAAPAPLYTDNHELWITRGADGRDRIHLFGYDRRTADLTAVGGPPDATVAGHYLLRLREDGHPEFAWSAWDHFRIADWIEPPRPGPVDPSQPDFDHPNSMDFDRDGNYIVSFRNLGEVIKIDARTGAILWRLGGTGNQFTFVDDPLQGFSAQHSARILSNGNLLLYDNGTRRQPAETRAVEYALDTVAKTATMVWEFRHTPSIYTPFVGSVQRLVNGNTLIGYAMVGHATEVGADGGLRWEADVRVDGLPAFTYRMLRLGSLYRAAAP